jgi:hypothetical protein
MSLRPTRELEVDRSAIFVDLQGSFGYGTRFVALLVTMFKFIASLVAKFVSSSNLQFKSVDSSSLCLSETRITQHSAVMFGSLLFLNYGTHSG